MPTPNPGESQADFVSRFMSSEEAKKDFPDSKQRAAVANDIFREKGTSKKKETTHRVSPIKIQKKEDGTYTGYIATTHPDRAADSELGVEGDILSVNALQQMADYVNDTSTAGGDFGSYRSVSLYHDWIHENDPTLDQAAFLKPTAKVVKTEDGVNYGTQVDLEVNKYYKGDMTPEEINYRIDNEAIAGLSIEFTTRDEDCRIVDVGGKSYRYVEEIDEFCGTGFARPRKIGNPHATIFKEVMKTIQTDILSEDNTNKTEVSKMEEDDKKGDETEAQLKEDAETKQEEKKKKPLTPEEEEEAAKKKKAAAADAEKSKKEIDEEETEKEEPAAEEKEDVKGTKKPQLSVKEIVESDELKAAVKEVVAENKVIKKKEEMEMEGVQLHIKEMNTALKENDPQLFREAASDYMREFKEFDNQLRRYGIPLTEPSFKIGQVKETGNHTDPKIASYRLRILGKEIQTKDTLDTASNAGAYTESPVEFSDLFIPGLIESFNDRTDLLDAIEKRPHIMGDLNYGWKITTTQKTTLSVDVDNPIVAKTFSGKLKLRTPIKEYRLGISVMDFMITHTRASIGDLFAIESDKAMRDMRKDINKDLYTEQADGDGTKILGLEAVADSTGNTTLYAKTRSTANRLSAAALTDTYTASTGTLTTNDMRSAYRLVWDEGAQFGNLMFIMGALSRQRVFELQDSKQQLFTAADFGFSGALRFDGIPILVDSDCTSDAIFCVDKESYYAVVSRPPQLVGLAKVGAAEEAYVMTNMAVVYELPRRIHMLDGITA